MKEAPLKPFLKWAGGKRWLFGEDTFSVPRLGGRYIEPFLGGGAVFFNLMPENGLLGDSNSRLIELYVVIRDECEALEALLRWHSRLHSKEHYYTVRALNLCSPVERAAQFLYLNRTCWNGLYRVNREGRFNVPIGTKQTVMFPDDDFKAWSQALSEAEIRHQDFELSIEASKEGDYMFIDPPYTVRHNVNGFLKYNERIFSWEDQVRLRDCLCRAVERGVHFAMTNADHWSVRELYRCFENHRPIGRHSVIAGDARFRSYTTELLVTK